MATATNVPQPVGQSKLAVVPFPHPDPVPDPVSQIELLTLLSLRSRAKKIEEELADAERSIKTRLEAGGYVEPGEHTAELKESSRRSVSWREVAERLGDKLFGNGKGDSYCERVLRSTKPTRTVSLTIQ
jgi:hypothetical protein